MAEGKDNFDPFQEAWKNPEKQFPLYIDEDHGLIVLPDALPVVENQILIIAREATPYQELPIKRQLQMMALASITAEHMQRVLRPKRKIGYAVWGNKIKTAHIHLLPRNEPDDGILFFKEHPRATPEQLKITQELLKFPPDLQRQAEQRLVDIESKLTD